MNGDIGCEICKDLLPLVEDGVASEASRAAVAAHLERCPDCRALAAGAVPPPPPRTVTPFCGGRAAPCGASRWWCCWPGPCSAWGFPAA